MRKFLIPFVFSLLTLAFLCGCATPPVHIPANAGKQANDCLPDAIEMVQGLRNAGIKSEVVRMGFQHSNMGHAIVAYIYPSGSNQLWVWDAENGSFRVRAFFADPLGIANSYSFHTASDEVSSAEIL